MAIRTQQTIDRISVLQTWLKQNNIDGMFVPRSDFWQGEEVMPCDERLQWLMGFTGSAGEALVLQNRAALFIDGRYTLQGAQQLAGTGVDVCHFTEQPWQDWLGDATGKKFAFDAKLSTPGWAERVQRLLGQKNATLAMLDHNPIDGLWRDRPAPNFTTAEIFPAELAGETSESKRKRLAAQLQERGQAGAFITDPTGIAWLLNIRARDYVHTPVALSVLFLKADSTAIWFTTDERVPADVRAHLGNDVAIMHPSSFVAYAPALSGQRIALDELSVTEWMRQQLVAAKVMPEIGRCLTALAKSAKNKTEIDGMRSAHVRDGVSLAKFFRWFDESAASGTSSLMESDIMAELESARASANEYRGPSFATISGFGENGAVVHYHTTLESDKQLAGDNLFLLDSGGQYVDGTTDITRTFAIGTPSAEHIRAYTLVLKGHIALATLQFPAGTTGHQIDAVARQPLWREGLNYDHGTGHGVGHYLSVHEGPARISIAPNNVALLPGMVLSNEPGYYKNGDFGIRIENLITVVEAEVGADSRKFLCFETLTLAPYERKLIDVTLLSIDERAWVDAYHQRVWDEISPKLDGADKAWLQQATRPL